MKYETKTIVKKETGEEIVRVTTEDERWYKIKDQYVPSVTWIPGFYPKGAAFIKWAANQKDYDEMQAVKKAAGEKGSKIHQACEALLNGEEVKHDSLFDNYEKGTQEELTADEYAAVMSLVDWLNEANPEILATEYVIVNEKDGYAGTVDLKCKIDGKTWIVDFRTGAQIWPEYEIQLSAYKAADPVDNIAILQLGYKYNKIKKYKFTEIDDQYSLFLDVKNIWAKETAGQTISQKDMPLSLSWKRKEIKEKTK